MNTTRQSRAGISLLEVLISIGILAVGLTSVLSFIPAGHSMAKTSLVTDQAAIVAANTLEDLVTEGYLRVDSLSGITSPVVIDPFAAGTWTAVPLGFTPAVLRQNGVLSVPTTLSPPRGVPAATYLARSRDDVIFNVPDSDAVDVTNSIVGGVRAYRGNFSWIAMMSKPGGGNFAAGDEVTLTVVVFHNRDTGQGPIALGPYNTPAIGQVQWPAGPLISDRKNTELIRSNGVCLVHQTAPAAPPSFRRISIAAIDDGDTGAFIEFDGPQPAGTATLYAVPDAVAVIEKTVTLEGPSPYSE